MAGSRSFYGSGELRIEGVPDIANQECQCVGFTRYEGAGDRRGPVVERFDTLKHHLP
jgi:hypothetical protein